MLHFSVITLRFDSRSFSGIPHENLATPRVPDFDTFHSGGQGKIPPNRIASLIRHFVASGDIRQLADLHETRQKSKKKKSHFDRFKRKVGET
jgi:hypothetical protein